MIRNGGMTEAITHGKLSPNRRDVPDDLSLLWTARVAMFRFRDGRGHSLHFFFQKGFALLFTRTVDARLLTLS